MNLYYYLDANNAQCGPVDASALSALGVTPTTLVWTQGMDEWQPASQVPELAPYLSPATDNTYYAGPTYYGSTGNVPDPAQPRPNNNLVWAILTTLFCCLPFGVYAIIRATKVNGLYDSGQYEEAQKAAKDARNFSIISAIIGLICTIIYIVFLLNSNNPFTNPSYDDSSYDDFYNSTEQVEGTDDYDVVEAEEAAAPVDDDYGYDDIDSPESFLETAIADYKSTLPIDVGNGITITDIQLTSNNVVYIAECDEDLIDVDVLNTMKATLKKEMRSIVVDDTDEDTQAFLQFCRKSHRGVAYKYVGSQSGKTCLVTIPYSEL